MSSFLLILLPALAAAATAPCCGPHKFTADMYFSGITVLGNGMPLKNEGSYRLAYDYNMRMVRADDMESDTYSITDYNRRMTFIFSNGMCNTTMLTDMDKMNQPCVPDDAMFDGSYALGSKRSSIMINTFRKYYDQSPDTQYVVKTEVTSDTCGPVSYSTYGMFNNVSSVMKYLFTDVTIDSLPAGVFDLPIECNVGKPMTNAGVVG